ncbi:Zinc finger MYM-type protein 1 [Aphis craccivora]|uniref:Zinc finger MYM-type protein 1 n=1 Tax=Aphis craccivora TaxID=307492 RepID=A0A6G0W0T4_APHCR|nr:Zinc finger MYM-type protein 1 [Aphis craccivora]
MNLNRDIKMLLTVNQNNKRKEYLIGKRGLSYRGHRNEDAHTLNNKILDHGNFLEKMMLLSKYDPVINEHFNTIIAKSETKYLADTTQDITVIDQCSIVIRYVLHDRVYEKLVAVKPCNDSSRKGMSELLLNTLQKLEINVENCTGNSTDGAANIQGQYKGMTSFLTKSSPNQVHVWCHSHILNLVLCDATKNPLLVASLFGLHSKCAI